MRPVRPARGIVTALASIAIVVAACGTTTPSPTPVATASPAASLPVASAPSPTAVGPSASAPSVGPSSGVAGSFDPTGQTVQATVAVTGFSAPLDVANAGDGSGRLFVVEQGGRIRVVKDGAILEPPFLDISDRIASGGERGLLGLAFHPDYPADPRFFVDYTDRDGNTVVAQYTVSTADPNVADPASETVLLHIAQPFANHNGGAVEFGPDGMLYMAMGDGGSAGDPQGNGQRLDTLLAKILRIDVAGAGRQRRALPHPRRQPVRVDRRGAGRRSGSPVCAIRGGSASIERPATCGSATSARVPGRRSTSPGPGPSGLDYGWNLMEGFHCYRAGDRLRPDGPDPAGRRVRPRRGLRGHRRGRRARRPPGSARRRVPVRRQLLGQPVADRPGRRCPARADPWSHSWAGR